MAIITVAGKEWVTSGADKGGSAAEVVDPMQNALAILQFPLVSVSSAAPDAAPTTQDFAVSFAAELPGLEGDVAFVDQTVIAADPSVLWVSPFISVPVAFPVRLLGTVNADGSQGVPAVPVDAALPDAEQPLFPPLASGPVTGPVTGTLSEEVASNAADILAGWSKGERVPDRFADGPGASGKTSKEAILQPEPLPTGGLKDVPSQEVLPSEQPGQRVQGWMANPHASPAAPEHKTQPAEGSAKGVGKVVTTVVEDALAPAPPSLTPGRAERPMGASAVSLLVSEAVPVPTEAASGETVPANLGQVETAHPQASEGPKTGKPATVEAPAMAALSGAEPAALSSSETPVATSFWERYFTDGSDIRSGSALPPDHVLQIQAERIASVIGLASRLIPGTGGVVDAAAPPNDMSELTAAGDGNDVAVTAPSPPAGSGPSQSPVVQSEPGPTLAIVPWSDGGSESVEGVDAALSSLPFLSSASASAVTPGPTGALSLPVQQVAMQLAGVLVQASDRATELALAPEELGKVRLRIEPDAANPDRLTIIINVERPETLDLFRRHAGELAEAIRNAGYSGAHIDFGGQGQGNGGDRTQDGSTAGSDLTKDEITSTQNSPRRIAGSTLDLRL